MKLKTRLIIAFFVVILVPFFLFSLTFFCLSHFQLQGMEKSYGISMNLKDFSDTTQLTGKAILGDTEKLRQIIENTPEKFQDTEFLEEWNQILQEKSIWLLVRTDGEISYNGCQEKINGLAEILPEYHASQQQKDTSITFDSTLGILFKQIDISEIQGKQISVFLLTTAEALSGQVRSLFLELILAMVVILVLTSACMVVWIYSGIRKPLKSLREGTYRIKNKDFDFEIQAEGKSEMSELCRDFDAMRLQLKEQVEEKERFDRQSRELISNISHDLKTPITSIKGYVEGIMDGVADTPEKMDRYIRTISIKTNDMDRLINELTFYSKIDTNRIPYQFAPLDVGEYFDDCSEDVNLELREREIAFSYINSVVEGTEIIADAEQLKRVINNIIGNSIKYMDKEKGWVQLRVIDADDFIRVEIEDNGKGIPTRELSDIFERFYRTDQSRNSSRGGSGIGLSIVKKIIEDHGGRIWATSKVGEGTTMIFEIRKYQKANRA